MVTIITVPITGVYHVITSASSEGGTMFLKENDILGRTMIRDEATGLIATRTDEGVIDTGDTLSNECFLRTAIHLKRRLMMIPCYDKEISSDQHMISMLFKEGYWNRSNYDATNKGKFLPSRDQWIQAIGFLAVSGNHWMLRETIKWLKNNNWRYPNGDVATGEVWRIVKRISSFGYIYEYIPLFVWDLGALAGSLLILGYFPRYDHDYDFGNGKRGPKWRFGFDPDHVDADKVHAMTLAIGLTIRPTFVMRLAAKIYFKYRKFAPKTEEYKAYEILLGRPSAPSSALHWYYRRPKNNPEIAVEWQYLLGQLREMV